jgi:hypothetical protein
VFGGAPDFASVVATNIRVPIVESPSISVSDTNWPPESCDDTRTGSTRWVPTLDTTSKAAGNNGERYEETDG